MLHSKLVKSPDRAELHQEAEIENITSHSKKEGSKADMEPRKKNRCLSYQY